MVIISLLAAMLLPALVRVSNTARKVACASNQKQTGLHLMLYADDWQGYFPPNITILPPSSM